MERVNTIKLESALNNLFSVLLVENVNNGIEKEEAMKKVQEQMKECYEECKNLQRNIYKVHDVIGELYNAIV